MAEETKKTVKERIVEISNELSIGREGKNDFQGFKYFKPDDILRQINPLLQKNRLFTKFEMTFNKNIEMYTGTMNIFDLDSALVEEYILDIPMTHVKGAGEAQNAGATMTYCKRYMIMNIFNIADNAADPDNEKNKPVDEKKTGAEKNQTKKTLEQTLLMIDVIATEKAIDVWEQQLEKTDAWTEVQKRVIKGRLDARRVELKK
jgi:hypothetical protein